MAIYDIEDLSSLDLPWWNLASIRQIDAILAGKPGARVFEWGSGASTLWLARRAAAVTSIEHDALWYTEMQARTKALPHIDLRLVTPDAPDKYDARYRSERLGWRGRSFAGYVREIERTEGLYDLVVIDGRARTACLEAALPRLAPGGYIVFDNSARKRYSRRIATSHLVTRTFRGLTACLPYVDETMLLSHE